MKQNNAVNFLLLFLCILLLGFVYINSKVIDQFYFNKNRASYEHNLLQQDMDGIAK